MAVDPLRKAHAEGQRLREAIDTEYRSARRDSTWGRTEPQMVERWRLAVRAWTQAVEAALGAEEARPLPDGTSDHGAGPGRRERRVGGDPERVGGQGGGCRQADRRAGRPRLWARRHPAAEPVPQALSGARPPRPQARASVENTVIG
jgi:hypothetical protein